jgi:hypothetical protein
MKKRRYNCQFADCDELRTNQIDMFSVPTRRTQYDGRRAVYEDVVSHEYHYCTDHIDELSEEAVGLLESLSLSHPTPESGYVAMEDVRTVDGVVLEVQHNESEMRPRDELPEKFVELFEPERGEDDA